MRIKFASLDDYEWLYTTFFAFLSNNCLKIVEGGAKLNLALLRINDRKFVLLFLLKSGSGGQ